MAQTKTEGDAVVTSWWIAEGPFALFGLEGGEAIRVEPGTSRAVRVIWPTLRDLPPNFGPFCSAPELVPVSPTEMRVYLGPAAPRELIDPIRRQPRAVSYLSLSA